MLPRLKSCLDIRYCFSIMVHINIKISEWNKKLTQTWLASSKHLCAGLSTPTAAISTSHINRYRSFHNRIQFNQGIHAFVIYWRNILPRLPFSFFLFKHWRTKHFFPVLFYFLAKWKMNHYTYTSVFHWLVWVLKKPQLAAFWGVMTQLSNPHNMDTT